MTYLMKKEPGRCSNQIVKRIKNCEGICGSKSAVPFTFTPFKVLTDFHTQPLTR